MKLKEKLKRENGGTWLSAILITIIVILVVIVLASVIHLAGTSLKTYQDVSKKDTEQEVLTMLDKD